MILRTRQGGEETTLRPPTVIFKSYTGDIIQCLGEEEMDVKVGDQVGNSCSSWTITTGAGHNVQVYITLTEHC